MNTRRAKCFLGVMLIVVLLASATLPALAASDGDDGKRARVRINAWPLLYSDGQVLSVMYPLSRFNSETGRNWVLPFFWGADYFVAFPAVWLFEDHKAIPPVFWGDDYFFAFPGITWASNGEGHRNFSFLWRVFRNERTEDGGRNLDVLFIPLMRSVGAGD